VVYPPLQIGVPKTPLGLFENLTATLTAYILGMKRDNWANALATRRGLLHRLKTTRTLVHTRLKIGPEFFPTLCKFCCLLHCQDSQT